jgi:anti-sigma B factor antagonist
MELALYEDGNVTIVALSGDLVIGDAEAVFKKTVSRLLEEGKAQFVVDCSGLRYVDSSGLGALVRALTLKSGLLSLSVNFSPTRA